MTLKLKNKKTFKTVVTTAILLFLCLALFLWLPKPNVWQAYDYKLLDIYYRRAVAKKLGPKSSFDPEIVYLMITDDTYTYFGKNFLDRKNMAEVNNALAKLNPAGILFDIIFARASTPEADQALVESLGKLNSVYLPTGLDLSENPAQFQWETGTAYENLRKHCFVLANGKGKASSYHALRALPQYEAVAQTASGTGDISAVADSDGIYRHIPLLVKVDSQYLPSLSLSFFLAWAGISPEEIKVEWGKRLTIPASKSDRLDKNVVIPMDEKARVYIPFVNSLGRDFNVMSVHSFLFYFSDKALRGNLFDFFEGKFVFIADFSTGSADIGYTPLEKGTSLVTTHASLLNGLLTHTFYEHRPFSPVVGIILLCCGFLTFAALFKTPWLLYGTFIAIMTFLPGLTWFEFINFHLFPIATVNVAVIFFFLGLTVTIEFTTVKDRAFIKKTFSKYVPQKVINQMLDHPERIKLGGEERTATVLFSDIKGFTTVSETLTPSALVNLLNEYFSEMTTVILNHDGIIDKYLGDAIMAEFGVPLNVPDHADQAVSAALRMQGRLAELREKWNENGLPQLQCRVGINTDQMVIGNIGSREVFDYTAIGDAVNLASRLEGANKLYGTSLVVSQYTHERLTPDKFKSRILDYVRVKGKIKPVKIYEVYDFGGMVPSPHEEYCKYYHQGFESYLSGNLAEAQILFSRALSLKPEDRAAKRMMARIRDLCATPLQNRWEKSVALVTK